LRRHHTNEEKSNRPSATPDDWTYGDWIDSDGPAGGIRSNALDMSQWIRMQLGRGTFEGNQLVGAENIATTHEPKVFASNQSFGEITSYASAWIYNSFSPNPVVWHSGSTSGMHSIVAGSEGQCRLCRSDEYGAEHRA
jgi:CubicO group peptidase (beta-lactamase class C family)